MPIVVMILISIHAPTRGATAWFSGKHDSGSHISIHAPTRGATIAGRTSDVIQCLFQSTLPRGERRRASHAVYRFDVISIHAPTRGATAILSKIHPMFSSISHNSSSFSSFPFHPFLPILLKFNTFCALFQVRISQVFSVCFRFAPKKSIPDLPLCHVLRRYVPLWSYNYFPNSRTEDCLFPHL